MGFTPFYPPYVFATGAPNSEHFSNLASGISHSKSYVTVLAAVAPAMPRTIGSAAGFSLDLRHKFG